MNILLQLYACAPDRGGEFAVSWQLLKQLDARAKSNDCIYVVSLTLKREDICNLTHVKLIEVPDVQRWSFLAPLDYIIWQYLAYKTLAKKKIHIDIVQAYSLSDYRMPGFWYKLNCRSILGHSLSES